MSAWTFPFGTILSVHDGDTLRTSISLGFSLSITIDVRLAGMNARELAMPGGPEAGAHLLSLAPVGSPCSVTVLSPDKYGGRYDANVLVNGVNLAPRMIADGYAAAWSGKGRKPIPPWPPLLQVG